MLLPKSRYATVLAFRLRRRAVWRHRIGDHVLERHGCMHASHRGAHSFMYASKTARECLNKMYCWRRDGATTPFRERRSERSPPPGKGGRREATAHGVVVTRPRFLKDVITRQSVPTSAPSAIQAFRHSVPRVSYRPAPWTAERCGELRDAHTTRREIK